MLSLIGVDDTGCVPLQTTFGYKAQVLQETAFDTDCDQARRDYIVGAGVYLRPEIGNRCL